MPLQSSGAISLNDVQNEFGGTNPIGMDEYYAAASGIPGSGTISLNHFYGASAVPLIGMLMSRELTLNHGYNNYTLSVTKDMGSASQRSVPYYANPNGVWGITPSGTRFRWNDWGDDFFDDWGDFYIYNPATGTAEYIYFVGGFMNNGDGTVWTQTQTAFNKQFRVRHGWATQGIYKIDVECTDRSFEFSLGCYGNMGADGQMVNEDRQHTVPWGKLNYNYNWQNTGTAPYREHFFTHFVPKLKSFNDSITANYSSGNFGAYLHTEPPSFNNTHGDNLAIWTSSLTIGGIWYFVKGGNSTTGAMYDWVANDIVSDDCLYSFNSHTFTSCGASGRTGPTITQVRTAYGPLGGVGTGMGYGGPTPLEGGEYNYLSMYYAGDWDFVKMTTQGIQLWTVPATGFYEIEMSGAKGGSAGGAGGFGGYVKGRKKFDAGTVLALIVGQAGSTASANPASGAGGGGASWVLSENLSTVHAVAAGGGGSNGTFASSAVGGYGDGVAQVSDSGGGASGSYSSGGGAGFGGNGSGGSGMGGRSPANGALGGDSTAQHSGSPQYQQHGGFGGGGANGWHSGGGGGGYAGGDAVTYTVSPGALGGTTYWNGTSGGSSSGLNGGLKQITYGNQYYSYTSTDHGTIKISRLHDLYVTYPQQQSPYSFTTHTFTPAGASGQTGPTLTQCRNSYSWSVWLHDNSLFNMTTQGIQQWTVPETGSYTITCKGASGGAFGTTYFDAFPGGGATMTATFNLTIGDTLNIVVGQKPTTNSTHGIYGSAGGGASWVYTGSIGGSGLIMVAGGGGGVGHGGSNTTAGNGRGGNSGQDSSESSYYSSTVGSGSNARTGTGSAGNKGIGEGGRGTHGNYTANLGSGGGAGWNSNGNNDESANGPSGYGGTRFVGGNGKTSSTHDNGGFGGGGGSGGNGNSGGGGGGYTGGGGGMGWTGSHWGGGGGGGSYIDSQGTNTTATAGTDAINNNQVHDGYVTITKI